MISLKSLIRETLVDKNARLYLGWVNKTNLRVMAFDIQSGEDETHHNYLMGLPDEWRAESDGNLIRWRYRRDTNTVYWWQFSTPTDDEKYSVEQWVSANLGKNRPEHRIIPTDRNSMNFWKSHSED